MVSPSTPSVDDDPQLDLAQRLLAYARGRRAELDLSVHQALSAIVIGVCHPPLPGLPSIALSHHEVACLDRTQFHERTRRWPMLHLDGYQVDLEGQVGLADSLTSHNALFTADRLADNGHSFEDEGGYRALQEVGDRLPSLCVLAKELRAIAQQWQLEQATPAAPLSARAAPRL